MSKSKIDYKIRNYLHINSLKNNKVTGLIVTLTEYGFDKIQDIEDNKEMKDYIRRLCNNKNPGLLYTEETIEKMSWLFSGDKDGTGIQQTWKKLNKLIDSSGVKVIRP